MEEAEQIMRELFQSHAGSIEAEIPGWGRIEELQVSIPRWFD